MSDAKVIHRYAPFALVRGALENACAAVWMIEPRRRQEGLACRLRFAITDVRNGGRIKQLTGKVGSRTEKERIDEIHAIAGRAGLDSTALKGRATYTEIVKAVDASGPANGMIEVSWKVCSGFKHGDWWTTASGSRRTQITGAVQEGVGTFKIEADLGLLMKVTTLAVRLTGRGWQLHDQRCVPPF